MNRYRWASVLVLLAPMGLVAWFLLTSSGSGVPPRRLPAAIPAPVQPAPRPIDLDDGALVACRAAAALFQRRG